MRKLLRLCYFDSFIDSRCQVLAVTDCVLQQLDSGDKSRRHEATRSVLLVPAITRDEAGVYTCRASNDAGNATVDVDVVVECKPAFHFNMVDWAYHVERRILWEIFIKAYNVLSQNIVPLNLLSSNGDLYLDESKPKLFNTKSVEEIILSHEIASI